MLKKVTNWFSDKFSKKDTFFNKVGVRESEFVSLLKSIDLSEIKIHEIIQNIKNSKNPINFFDILKREGIDEVSVQNFIVNCTRLQDKN